MKQKLLYLELCLLLSIGIYAQAPTIQWQKALGGTQEDQSNAIAQTADGGFITVGYIYSNDGNITVNHGAEDYWIVKFDNAGTIQWQKSYGGSDSDIGTGIVPTSDGGYLVLGYSHSTDGDVTGGHGEYDFWVLKINSLGTILWQKTYGGSSPDVNYGGIRLTSDGGFIICGVTSSYDGDVTNNQGNGEAWVVKLDVAGVIQWQKTYGGTEDDRAVSIKQTSDGGYIFAGKTYSNNLVVSGNHGDYDYWVVKISPTGILEWQKCLGGTLMDEAKSISQTSDGGYIVMGIVGSSNGDITGFHGQYDAWVAKLNAAGTLQWQRALGGSNADRGFDVLETTGGGFIALGCPQSQNGDLNLASDDSGSYWLVKLNASGIIQWQKTYGGTNYDEPSAFVKTTSNEFAVTGYTYSNDGDVSGNHGDSDYWVLKLGAELDVPDFNGNSVKIYPNPVSDLLQIEAVNGFITTVKITDVTGKTVLQQFQDCYTIDVSGLAHGAYLLNVYSDTDTFTAKFIKQ